jgi:hypothetical protein
MNKIKLEKGIINYMLPFRLGSGESAEISDFENEIWTKTAEAIPRLDFLLEHVKEFFTKNIHDKKVDDSACLILKLKKETLPVKMFNNKNYWLTNKPLGKKGNSKNLLMFSVYIDPGAFRIILHPFSRVAILLFCVELGRSKKDNVMPDLTDFIRMNYLLRLFNRADEPFFISQNDRPEERGKALQLLNIKSPGLFGKNYTEDVVTTGWRSSQLINYLLYDLNARYRIEFFDHFHFSPVSYVQPSEEIIDQGIVQHTLFYLRNVYDFDYTPTKDILEGDNEILHPFKQIYYASSLEGAVVLNNCNATDPEFIKTFYSTSYQKTLWLTILGFLQRSIFLQLMKEVASINPDDHKQVKEYLRRYTSISLKAIFSKVSVYHQHNDYYDLLIHNLQINELKTELKEELIELNNLQRQFHEDEMEKYEETEKQYDKKFNSILFALSVFGLMQVTYAVLGSQRMNLFQHSLAIGIPMLLGFIFWKMLSVRKK